MIRSHSFEWSICFTYVRRRHNLFVVAAVVVFVVAIWLFCGTVAEKIPVSFFLLLLHVVVVHLFCFYLFTCLSRNPYRMLRSENRFIHSKNDDHRPIFSFCWSPFLSELIMLPLSYSLSLSLSRFCCCSLEK